MKHIFSIQVIAVVVAMALTTSCKKEDTPTPNNSPSNIAPTVTASVSNSNPATITVSATDSDGSISKVEIWNGSTLLSTLTTSPYTYTTGTLANGSYTYTVKAYDNANATTSTTVSFTISSSSSNHAPTFTSSSVMVTSNGSAQTFALPVTDADGNTVTITGITGASSNVAITYSGLNVTVTPNNSIFAGAETLSISVTDGTTSTTSNFTINVGETNQISTYNMLAPFFGTALTHSDIGTCTLKNNGTIVTTMTQPSAGFFTGAASPGTYSYKILPSGDVQFTAGALTTEYTVYKWHDSTYGDILTFTRIDTGDAYNLY